MSYYIKKCRVCGGKLKEQLIYYNTPKSAQHLPEFDQLDNDRPIDLKICECQGCGLIQLSNEPVFYWKEVIRSTGLSDELKNYRKKQFNTFLERYKPQNIVEIGCGRGENLEILNGLGIKNRGLTGFEENIPKYDSFFTFNYLEHLPDPNSYLQRIYNNSTEDVVGIVEVPDFDMILHKGLFAEFTPDHLFYFTLETLKFLLNKNGFELMDYKIIQNDYILSVVVKKRESMDKFYFNSNLRVLTDSFNRFETDKIAIYGASHQTLFITSLLNLKDKIKYIIDDTPSKQGKYSPSSHIPIVSKEHLISDPVDIVIVSAGSFSDEVAKKPELKDLNIYILRNNYLEKYER